MNTVIPIKNTEEIKLIKDYFAKNNEMQYLLMFTLAINTGIDFTSLLNLKVKDVKDKDYFSCEKQKLVPLNDELKELIALNVGKRKGNEYLFRSSRGPKYSRFWVFRKFKEACTELGMSDKYSVASWRKTFAYHYYEKYKDLSYLMWLFNQHSIEVALKFVGEIENMNLRYREGVCL